MTPHLCRKGQARDQEPTWALSGVKAGTAVSSIRRAVTTPGPRPFPELPRLDPAKVENYPTARLSLAPARCLFGPCSPRRTRAAEKGSDTCVSLL